MPTPLAKPPGPAGSDKDLVASSLADEADPRPPERYGKYNLLERIAVGGMAEVWRAKTLGTEGFTKDLVIKRILPRLTRDEDFVRMFIDEARLVARLQHANIVQIFDFDREGDTYYLAMELVDGRDLRQLEKAAAKKGVWFSISTAVYLIAEALKGLHYAHTKVEHGQPLLLVHRDISPHNILISQAGDVKIADFGIAKVADRASKTVNGMVKGKLAYMSPEQISGQPLDSRTDVYSMGVVLWELITKNRLFQGPMEGEVIRRVRDGVVPPPRTLNPEVPEALQTVVMKMLVPDRERRYQSAGEVARDLCALSCYAYEAQALGDLLRALFPHNERDWTRMLQSMSAPAAPDDSPGPDAGAATTSMPVERPVPQRSNMAGSDQKTVMATEVPPEVAARLAAQKPQPAPVPPAAVPAAAGARTVMAQAPVLPAAAPAAGARTVMAQAPVLPAGLPPPLAPPPPGLDSQAKAVAPGGYAQGLPPPAAPGGAAPGGANPQATVMIDPKGPAAHPGAAGGHGPGAGRPLPAPLPLRPAHAVFGPGETVSGAPPYLRWILGPLLSLGLAVVTLFLANRIWPPATGSGGRGPSFLAMKGQVRIVTTPAGATLYQDGVALPDKTPAEVRGDVGKKSRVKVELAGYDPYEVVIPFTKEERPPLNVTLFQKGKGQNPGKPLDPSVYDDRPGTKTTRDPADDDDDKPAVKPAAAEDKPKEDKVAEAPKPDKGDATADDGSSDDQRKDRHHRRHGKDSGGGPAAALSPAKGKATLSVSVRPWAIVYLDGKKIGQTPLREYPVSPGRHTLLLVNDTKGKRENVSLTADPGGSYPITKTWE